MKRIALSVFVLLLGTLSSYAQHGSRISISLGANTSYGTLPATLYDPNPNSIRISPVKSPNSKLNPQLQIEYAQVFYQVPQFAIRLNGQLNMLTAGYEAEAVYPSQTSTFELGEHNYFAVGIALLPEFEYRFRQFRTQDSYFYVSLNVGINQLLYDYWPNYENPDDPAISGNLSDFISENNLRHTTWLANINFGYHFGNQSLGLGYTMNQGYYYSSSRPVGFVLSYSSFFGE